MTALERRVADAQDAIAARLTWASLHWGTEAVHPDAWPHIARAAVEAVLERPATSGHEIVWTFERGALAGRVVCHERPDADCRLEGSGDCGCEAWTIERDPDGTPFHMVDGVRHGNEPASDCNVVLFLEGGDDVEELAVADTSFELTRTRIEPVWDYDHYLWKVAP